MVILLIAYLIGVLLSFCYLAFVKEEPYEIVICVSIFYPIIALVMSIAFVGLSIWATIWWIVEGIKDAIRRKKNDK